MSTSAFPTGPQDQYAEPYPGLTRRELFAAMAMQGMLSSPNPYVRGDELAQTALYYTDALIAELDK